MEIIIVIIIIAAAVYALVRMFTKQASGEGGCACDSKCGQCPKESDEQAPCQ
ncbi:MAG: FeoB-associated Cys-rich membrane protein [Planctomycetota bacterium]|jgi:hypothetical protein